MRAFEPALVDLARAQHGAFSSAQAHRLGVDDLTLSRLTLKGELVRVRQAAYLLAAAVEALTPEQRYARSARAILLTRPPLTWLSHHAALAIAGLPLVGVDLARFDVCAEIKRSFRRSGLVSHVLPDLEPCLVVDGARCVSTELAIVQTTFLSGLRAGVVAADAALHSGLVSSEALSAAGVRTAPGKKQSRQLEALLSVVDARAESPGESLSRLLLTGLGWPVSSQVDIYDAAGFVGRVDFLVGERVVVEFDGLVKYEGAGGREALAREKRREDRLRAAGYEVVRLTWADLRAPERVARPVRQAMARTRLAS
ncbi:hypothetical protein SAMN05216199_0902 [Pedococcus cremeus]|uniref:AbiEi antitoxin N-terminal domain-containing protein n=1 Tax=Pedococcus cremeus TaxID=587636 RepID=A0A1H9R9F1_9MICO|nr:type IV toxin-antitoxin system AbiEi family antitoxin domain-containing protein [Pedococcus cremeus]SER69288.1 hypothetical protein SAMN05216199_0902 [Pedococcus cremeus]